MLHALCHSLVLSRGLILPSSFDQGQLLLPRPHAHLTGSAESGGDPSTEPDGILNSIVEGLPVHPLYAPPAAALYRWIRGGHFPRNWALIAELTESLLRDLLNVQEPYSSLLKNGHKVVEGRCATDSYRSLRCGDLLLVNESLLLQIKKVCWYSTFQAMIEAEGCLKFYLELTPSVKVIGVKVYRKFYIEAKELLALGIDGVRALLGMRATIGTVKEALPLPMSLLVDSFSALQKPDVAGCWITVGARALAKHAPQSLDGWWGSMNGTETEKNKLAESTLHHVMNHAVWMNIHLSPIPLLEIRVLDGYGTR